MSGMHIGGLRFNQLQLIEALARTGNITDAAKHIGITQPAASHALARLRRSMRDPIFIRTSEGMKPTPYGARLAAAVRDATKLLEYGLDRSPDFDPGRSTRIFNVFLSDVGQWLFLPKLLEALAVSAPGIGLRVRPLPAKAPHLMLESGEIDIAVGTFTGLITGCMSRKDPPSFVSGMTLEAFRSVPHAVAEGAGYVHEALDRWLARQKIQRCVKINVPNYLVLPLIVARSDLLAITAGRVAEMFATMVPIKIMPLPMKIP